MAITPHSGTVKVVGTNGQISLGKQYAGRQVLVEECEPGVWLVRTATVVPDNERWLHESQAAADLQAAMSISIRIDDALYETAKVRAKAEMRSIPQQVAYWAKVGRAALDNPDLPIEFVRDTLVAMEEESEPFELPEA